MYSINSFVIHRMMHASNVVERDYKSSDAYCGP